MPHSEHKVREPLLHIAKRDSIVWWRAWLIRGAVLLAALIFAGFVSFLLTKENPLRIYLTMLDGAFGTQRRIWGLAQNLAMLLCVSIAVTPAFKMRFWNIGAEGQVLIGGLATAACMILLGGKMPNALLLIVMVIASIAAGALWGVIPAFFRAHWQTNETLFTLMMNYIAIQLVAFFTYKWSVPKGSGQIGVINRSTHAGWLPSLGGQDYLLNIIIVLVITAAMYVYLKYSKQGYEIAVVGESENTARYIGIPVKKVIIRTMLISGAICGISGLLIVAGTDHTISRDSAAGRGFTAIMVSWLAKFDPVYMILTAFLIVFLQKGATEISTAFSLNESFSDIITGIIIFFIISSEFFIQYSVRFRRKGGGCIMMWAGFLQRAVMQGIPLLYGSTGEILTEKSGMLNLGIPGIMYVGGIGGVIGAFLYEQHTAVLNPVLAVLIPLLCSMLGSLLMGLIYCFLTVTLRANQNVTGLALTTFGVGFGNFFGGSLARLTGSDVPSINLTATSACFRTSLPFADDLGWSGQIFLSHSFLAYAAIIIALFSSFVLTKTRIGLHLRAVGENPATADAAGINVGRYQYFATCLGSITAGLGGLYYVMDYANGVWSNDGFGDRGWLAIALVIFAVWRPNLGILGSILFGGLYIVHNYIRDLDVSGQELFKMLPYVVTIMFLVVISMRRKREAQPPAHLGLPYFREER